MITAGEVLKRKRESLEKSLEVVSSDTKIQKRFLEYIEDNQYDKFDSEIFASGFIKIYSQYLDLDVDKLQALYRRSRPAGIVSKEKKSTNAKKKSLTKKIDITPKGIAIIALAIFLLAALSYIIFQIYQFQKPPYLEISQPQDGITTQQEKILIEGNTDIGSTLEVNGDSVQTDPSGWFSYEIKLNEGLNTINVKSKKEGNSTLESNKTIRVTLESQQEEIPIVEDKPKEFKLKVEITDTSAWIKLDVDGENKISQILTAGTIQQFTFTQGFTITSGKVLNTKLTVDDQPVNLLSQQSSGVATLSCKVVSNTFTCD